MIKKLNLKEIIKDMHKTEFNYMWEDSVFPLIKKCDEQLDADYKFAVSLRIRDLNEYKAEYQKKISENPNYDYSKELIPDPVPHKCPVCGEYTFKDNSSYDICPVCGWEDDGWYEGGGANSMSLEEAIDCFKKHRETDPKYKWINTIKK